MRDSQEGKLHNILASYLKKLFASSNCKTMAYQYFSSQVFPSFPNSSIMFVQCCGNWIMEKGEIPSKQCLSKLSGSGHTSPGGRGSNAYIESKNQNSANGNTAIHKLYTAAVLQKEKPNHFVSVSNKLVQSWK